MLHILNWKYEEKKRKKAVDIVLDVSKSFQGNVYSEILSKVIACQHGIWQLFRT